MNLLVFLTVATSVIGCAILLPPSRQYWSQFKLSVSGLAFLFVGAVLILNYKWSGFEVSVLGSQLKVQAAQLEAQADQLLEQQTQLASLNGKLQENETLLASLQEAEEEQKTYYVNLDAYQSGVMNPSVDAVTLAAAIEQNPELKRAFKGNVEAAAAEILKVLEDSDVVKDAPIDRWGLAVAEPPVPPAFGSNAWQQLSLPSETEGKL